MSKFTMENKKGLIIGIANDQSLAYGCARALSELDASLAITYLNDKAKPHVEPLTEGLNTDIFLPCNVCDAEQIDALFDAIEQQWGRLDFLIHSIAFAPLNDLHGRLTDASREGFLQAMEISCYSLIDLASRAEPLMSSGGSILTMTYLGAERAVANYNLMGPVKSGLESSVRYLARELGGKSIRVNAISAGPVATRAASGLAEFNQLLELAIEKAPLKKSLDIDDIGSLAAFLASDKAAAITGETHYVDCGYHAVD